VIHISNVSKTFVTQSGKKENVVNALDNVSLEIGENEFVALIGPSGCGKTTLLKIIGGLLPYDAGQVVVDGTPVTGPGPDRALVFQSFALLPWRNVLANVELGLEARGVDKKERQERSLELIRRVGLGGFEQHYPHELSGGMQQRAGLARALAVRPKILLMDEPFGSLDEQTRRLLHEDLLQIWESQRQTVVFVTHSMDEAVYLSDRVVIMSPRPGRIREVLDIGLPRPRLGDAVRRSGRFGELTEYVWGRIREFGQPLEAA
jgi:NitT/TauT family transport system ATP-binding protein